MAREDPPPVRVAAFLLSLWLLALVLAFLRLRRRPYVPNNSMGSASS